MKAGIYKYFLGEKDVVTYRPITQKEFDTIVKIWGKSMSLPEFVYSSQKVLDEYENKPIN